MMQQTTQALRAARAAYMRVWRERNIEKARALGRASYIANKSKAVARMAQYRRDHRDELRAKNSAYHVANREKHNERTRAYYAAHHDQFLHYARTKRARKAGNGGAHTLNEWRAKCSAFDERCAYCGVARKLTRDHDVPLSRGGTDDIANILPACMPCNRKKHTQTAAEFRCMLGTNE